MWYLVMNGIIDLKRYLVEDWDTLFRCRCAVDLDFFPVPFTFEIKASFEMLPPFIFLPIVMEIHPLNPRQ